MLCYRIGGNGHKQKFVVQFLNFSLPERGSVGEKFFESTTNISLMKRIKKRLTEAAEFHHTAMSEQVKRQSDVLNSCNSGTFCNMN